MDPRLLRSVGVTVRVAVLLLTLSLLAAGCGDDDEESRAAPAAGGSPARLAEAITFEVVGGDEFRDDEITVQPDGSARVQTRFGERTTELAPGELSALARDTAAADLATAESALREPPVADALWYRFTYRGKQVETDDPEMPDALRPLIANFIGLVDRYGK